MGTAITGTICYIAGSEWFSQCYDNGNRKIFRGISVSAPYEQVCQNDLLPPVAEDDAENDVPALPQPKMTITVSSRDILQATMTKTCLDVLSNLAKVGTDDQAFSLSLFCCCCWVLFSVAHFTVVCIQGTLWIKTTQLSHLEPCFN